MSKRNGVRQPLLVLVNVVVIVGAGWIINSRAAEDGGLNFASFLWPTETEPALRSPTDNGTALSEGSSSPAATRVPSSAGWDISVPPVAPTGAADSAPYETNELLEQVWYGPVHPAFAPMPSDPSPSQSDASLSGDGATTNRPGSRARSASAGGYGGGGGGGGFPSSGGGRSNGAQSSLSSASDDRAGLLSNSDSSIAGTSLLPTPAQGNPPFGTPGFTVLQFPSQGARATLPSPGAGSTAGVSQLQPVAVPEPSTLLLLGCGLALATYRSRRKLTP